MPLETTMSDTASLTAIVHTYLELMEARDLDAAAAFLDPAVVITFPGGRTFHDLHDQVASSAGRFEFVRKHFARFDVVETGTGAAVVYAFGTLAGKSLQGSDFDGIRFIDRFTIVDGLIVDQMVWNDLAESGVI
jgi:hypothetical protein